MLRKTIISFLAVLLLTVTLSVGITPVHAASASFNSYLSIGCAASATGFLWSTDSAGPYDVRTIVSAGGSIYMDEIVPALTGTSWNWHLYNSNSGGTRNAFFPLPANTPINVTLSLSTGPSFSFSFFCDQFLSGPQIPAGFVLRTITCDVAVFSSPAGEPVSTGERIIRGQTWYVSPTPVKTNSGRFTNWTEIFAGGPVDGFIPTACVGGKPAGYTGD